MENKKINIAELLKDCPKGMELDCILFKDTPVYLHEVTTDTNYPIEIKVEYPCKELETFFLNKYGAIYDRTTANCIIFPKGETNWEGFHKPFEDGDVVISDHGDIHISKDNSSSYCCKRQNYFDATITTHVKFDRLATEEEKQKLFDAIKDNGYKWNTETKTLEKLVKPKFKVGDIIRDITGICKVKITKVNVEDEYYLYKSLNINGLGSITFNGQDDWKLVPNKFDITTLVPFESRVLVRDHELHKWHPAMWGYYDCDSQDYPYKLVGSTTRYRISYEGKDAARYCIPYEGNEHLLGTTNDCDEYYKTW